MKNRFYILLIILFFVFNFSIDINSQDSCNDEPPSNGSGAKGPGGDTPDDNFSYSDGVIRGYNLVPGAVVFTEGFFKATIKMFKGSEYNGKDYGQKLLDITPYIIIPTGALTGKQNDSTFKYKLKEYVRLGGTIIVFAQQQGYHFDNLVPIPEGEALKSYGWREDNSCLKNSAYFVNIHPVVSSSTTQLVDAGIDGYFETIPSNATVFLTRNKNRAPAMISYPYGENGGRVILTSLYTDWAFAHSQATTNELRIVRDLVTWAKDPNTEIPMFNLADNPTPEIVLNINMKNDLQANPESANSTIASKAKIYVYTPNKKTVLFETEQSVTLNAGEMSTASLTFTLPAYLSKDYGICHTEYELYDAENNLIQMKTESFEGRFSIYTTPSSYVPRSNYDLWVTSDDDHYIKEYPPELTINVKNHGNESITLDLYYDISHYGYFPIPSFTIEANSIKKVKIQTEFPTFPILWSGNRLSYNIRHRLNTNQNYLFTRKGIFFVNKITESEISIVNPNGNKIYMNQSINYTINSKALYINKINSGNSNIRLVLYKLDQINRKYETYKLIDEKSIDYHTSGSVSFSGYFIRTAEIKNGSYKFKIEGDNKEYAASKGFSFPSSKINILSSGIYYDNGYEVKNYLSTNKNYDIKIRLKNELDGSNNSINSGKIFISLKHESGSEVYNKTIENISIPYNDGIYISENLVFLPTKMGKYYLTISYIDDTMMGKKVISKSSYKYIVTSRYRQDKEKYSYLDTANIDIEIFGIGTYNLKLYSSRAGILENRPISIPAGTYSVTERLSIPIGLRSHYDIAAYIEDLQGNNLSEHSRYLLVNPPIVEINTKVENKMQAGNPLDFNASIKQISGFSAPVTCDLIVRSSFLGYNSRVPVTINPTGENIFNYSIPVSENTAPGYYNIEALLLLSEDKHFSKDLTVKLSKANISHPGFTKTYSPGDVIPLSFFNSGGIPYKYNIDIVLKNYNGQILKQSVSKTIGPMTGESIDISLPDDLKSGQYILITTSNEMGTEILKNGVSIINIPTGIDSSLNSYTLKNKYFSTEIVSGKSEISLSGGDLTNGVLSAKIKHKYESNGVIETKPGKYYSFNTIGSGFNTSDKLYLSSDAGLLEYDKTTLSHTLLAEQKGDTLYISSSNEVWLGDRNTINWRSSDGIWNTYSTSGRIADIKEGNYQGTNSIWIATNSGINIYSNNQWHILTTADGLPSNRTYALARDESNNVWISTSSGVLKYNGSNFESISAPFGTSSVSSLLTSTDDGAIWMVISDKIYRYKNNLWDEWNVSEFIPGNSIFTRIYDIKGIGNTLWVYGSVRDTEYNFYGMVMKYKNAFSVYSSITNPELKVIDSINSIISGSNNDVYFIGDLGFIKYENEIFIFNEINKDKYKLPAGIDLLINGGDNTLWASTRLGISKYDGTKWENIFFDNKGDWIRDIIAMAKGPGGTVYAVINWGDVLKINNNKVVERIPYPVYGKNFPHIAIDGAGTIWLGGTYFYSYSNGVWTKFEGYALVEDIIKAKDGSIWVASWNDLNLGSPMFHIYRINDGIVTHDFTSENSNILLWDKDKLYFDSKGVLWIKEKSDSGQVRALESFDGTTWINYSSYSGFPEYGVEDFVENKDGKLVIIDRDGNLFTLDEENKTFILGAKIDYSHSLVNFDNNLYCSGGEPVLVDVGDGGSYFQYVIPNNFLKISSDSGILEEEVWSKDYPVNMSSGESLDLDLLTNQTLPAGSYILRTRLLTSDSFELGSKNYLFNVRENGLSISISNAMDELLIKPDSDLLTDIEILNNSEESYTDLTYRLKKISPSGIETIIKEETVNIISQSTFTDSIIFNESTEGAWKLIAELIKNSGGGGGEEPPPPMPIEGGEPGAETLLSGSEQIIEVVIPKVETEFITPEFVSKEPYDVKIRLLNTGKIDSSISINLTGVSSGDYTGNLILKPLEERIIAVTDSLTSDRIYNLSISGDIEFESTKIIKYAYKSHLNIAVNPDYREGSIKLDYTVNLAEGLAFKDTVFFELYQAGNAAPIYTTAKEYNIYPGLPLGIADSLNFNLIPGTYELRYRTLINNTQQSFPIIIKPSGIGTIEGVSDTGVGDTSFPIGFSNIGFKLINSDTVAGSFNIIVSLKEISTDIVVFNENRNYYLPAGEIVNDEIFYDFTEKKDYVLEITGTKLTHSFIENIFIKNLSESSADISIGEVTEEGFIPVTLNVNNTGYNDFYGSIDIETDGMSTNDQVIALSSVPYSNIFKFSTEGLIPGSKNVKATLYDTAGLLVTEKIIALTVTGPNIEVSEIPEDLEIDAGSFAEFVIKLKNTGDQYGEAVLKLTAGDGLYREQNISLNPGEEIEIDKIIIDADADLPTGNYNMNYSCTAGLNKTNRIEGIMSYRVKGLTLEVNASLSDSNYEIGDTAVLTVDISSETAVAAPLEIIVNWGDFNEVRQFTLESGSATLNFNIPVDEPNAAKVFYGIYHEGGKGIHLNDIYLSIKDKINIDLNKQVYEPGDAVQAAFSTGTAGSLTAAIGDDSFTVNISSTELITFILPDDILGGTYGVSWEFTPADPNEEALAGNKPFDVAGLVVKTAKSELVQGKYAPGENIEASFTFESNIDIGLELKCWTVRPSGEWDYLGSSNVNVLKEKHITAVLSYAFTTEEAGTHNFVYGLYRDGSLVISGGLAFDVGDAVLLGVSTDKNEYKNGTENAIITIDFFGEGSAVLDLYLDNVKLITKNPKLSGLGKEEIILNASTVNGGSHDIKVLLLKDGLISEKSTSFIYGTNLPDFSLYVSETIREDLNLTYKIIVANSGKTAAATTMLTFKDNDTGVSSITVSSLASGESSEHTIIWNGSGKAGEHNFEFIIDESNTIKELNEDNNILVFTENIPEIFYKLRVDPEIWIANTEVNIISRIINNQNIQADFSLNLSIISDMTGEAIFEKTTETTVPVLGSRLINETFNTGIHPAGEYLVSQTITDGGEELTEEIAVIIEATKKISGTLEINPQSISSDVASDVELTMNLKNMGNVNLEDEPLKIEVVNMDNEETVNSSDYTVSKLIGEEKEEKTTVNLSLSEGTYEVRINHLDYTIANAELLVNGGIEKEKGISIKPRVHIMNMKLFGLVPGVHDPEEYNFISATLSYGEITHDISFNAVKSYIEYQSGEHNINIVFGSHISHTMRDELMERVFRGEGLILIADKPIISSEMRTFLGVKVKPVPRSKGEYGVNILNSEISSESEFELKKKNRFKLEKLIDDVVFIGKTKTKNYPVISYRKYGNGNIVVIAAPLKFRSGSQNIAALLLNIINGFSKDLYSSSDIERILPLELKIKNNVSETKDYIIKEILPYGTKTFGYNLEPETGTPGSGTLEDSNDLKWNLSIAGRSEKTILYWLKLPDTINNYEIKTEIYEGEKKIDEISVSFDVNQVILSRLDELVTEIESLSASGRDLHYLNKAKRELRKVRNRNGESFWAKSVNLKDIIKASTYLGKVIGTDVGLIRLKAQNIMMVMARRVYDRFKAFTPFNMNTTADRMMKE